MNNRDTDENKDNSNVTSNDDELTRLIKAMVSNVELKSYKIIHVNSDSNEEKDEYSQSNPALQLSTLYQGDKLTGEVIVLKNETQDEIEVKEEGFNKSNVIAVVVGNYSVGPGLETKIYRVVKNENV